MAMIRLADDCMSTRQQWRWAIRALRLAVLAVCLVGGGGKAHAQQLPADVVVVPEGPIAPLDPVRMSLAPSGFEFGTYIGYLKADDFGSDAMYGTRLAYHATRGLFAELDYASTNPDDTSYQRFSGSAPRLADSGRKSDYYAVSLGYEVLPGDRVIGRGRALSGALYVLAGAGSISLAKDDQFMLSYGAGYRVQASDEVALRIDIRDFLLDPGFPDVGHNVEINLGAAWFF